MPMKPSEQSAPDRDADFLIIDEIRRAIPDYPPEEVERDVAEAVAAVRAIDVYAGRKGSVEEVFGGFSGRVIFHEAPEAPTADDWEDSA